MIFLMFTALLLHIADLRIFFYYQITNFIPFPINLKESFIFVLRFKIISCHFHNMFTKVFAYVFNEVLTSLLSKDSFERSTFFVIKAMSMFPKFQSISSSVVFIVLRQKIIYKTNQEQIRLNVIHSINLYNFSIKITKIYRLVMKSTQNVSLMNQQETFVAKFVAHKLEILSGHSFFIEVAQFENQSHFQFMAFYICILLTKRIQESSIKYQQKKKLIQKIVTFQQESLNNQNECYKIKIQEFKELLQKKLSNQKSKDSKKKRDIDDQLELKLQEQFFELLKFNPEKKGQKFSIFSKYHFEVMLKTLQTTDKSSQKVSLLKFILQTLLYNHSFVILFGSKAWSQDFINTVFQYLQYIKSIPLIQNIQEPQKLIQQIQKFYQMKNKSSTYKSLQNMIKKTIEQWTNNSYFVFMGKNFQHPQLFRFSKECYFGLHLQKNLLEIVIEQIQSDRHSENIKVYLNQIKQILDITINQK